MRQRAKLNWEMAAGEDLACPTERSGTEMAFTVIPEGDQVAWDPLITQSLVSQFSACKGMWHPGIQSWGMGISLRRGSGRSTSASTAD